jgi:hypothetical protein
MSVVWMYAIAAGIIGLLPASSFVLIPLEAVMVYHLSTINKRPFSLGELAVIWAIVCGVSTALGGFIGTIFVVMGGPIGWIAKAGVAFAFVLGFGVLVNWYFQTENKKQAAQSSN